MTNQNGFNPAISPEQQTREARLNALEQEQAMRRDAQYQPWSYPGYPYGTPQNYISPQNPQAQIPQQIMPNSQSQIPSQSISESQNNQNSNEYLQGYPIEGLDQLREARVGLDGRVSIFPFLAENCVYTKQTNLDGLPEYKRFILDESFEMEEISNPVSEDSNNLKAVIAKMESLHAEMYAELQALREERKNATAVSNESTNTASGSNKTSSPAGSNKRGRSNANSSTTTDSKSANESGSGDPISDAKG